MIAYTDGVIETRNPEGQFYSLDYLFADIKARSDKPVQGLCGSILDAVGSWRVEGEAEDDITVMAMAFQEIATLKN